MAVTYCSTPFILGRKETPRPALLPRHWGARASSFCKNFFFSLRVPSEAYRPLKPLGGSWAEAGAPSSWEESWLVPGTQRTAAGQGRVMHANDPGAGKAELCSRGRQRLGLLPCASPGSNQKCVSAVCPSSKGGA